MIRLLKHLYWDIQRVIRWIPVIWKNKEFDHSYFLQILSFKFKLMEEFYSSKYAISVDSEKCAEEIHICKLLCDRLIADNYHDMLGREIRMYPNDKGVLQFETLNEGCQFGISKDWQHYESYMQNQDLRYLCEILQKHLFSWWD